jgi:flagellar assembly factor FliW
MSHAEPNTTSDRLRISGAFGEMDVDRRDIIRFPDGLPGFEHSRAFVLLASEENAPLQYLHAVEGAPASFLAIDPRFVLENYRCELNAADEHRLGAAEGDPLLWLALVMVESNGAITVNLRAPLVVNPKRMVGHQMMPHQCLYPLRHVLTPAP